MNEPWSLMQGAKRTRKTTLRSERRSALKKYLTEPTLLEMSGYPTYRDLAYRCWMTGDQGDIELQQMSHEYIEREGCCDAVCRSRRGHREKGARPAAAVFDGLTEAAARDKT
jgi:hypothetical protein